ncbi:hypothetical protein PR048_030265 [Dryococelus australis]|uniref:Uncharacterized protein n=1 Tax=Dryococelus australis TaxID=614101 RepID=A0ABQ9GCE0_9NEOP|nr:hypothetical protein PR048_030265 [Dryococelus australis]
MFIKKVEDNDGFRNGDDFIPSNERLDSLDATCSNLGLSPASKIKKFNCEQQPVAIQTKLDKLSFTLESKLGDSFETPAFTDEPQKMPLTSLSAEYILLIEKLKNKIENIDKKEKVSEQLVKLAKNLTKTLDKDTLGRSQSFILVKKTAGYFQQTIGSSFQVVNKRKFAADNFALKTIAAFLKANIPLGKLQERSTREWMKKFVARAGDLPTVKTSREKYVPLLAEERFANVKANVAGKFETVLADERKHAARLTSLIDSLEGSSYSTRPILHSKLLHVKECFVIAASGIFNPETTSLIEELGNKVLKAEVKQDTPAHCIAVHGQTTRTNVHRPFYIRFKEMVKAQAEKKQPDVDVLLSIKHDVPAFECAVLRAVWLPCSNVDSDRCFSSYGIIVTDRQQLTGEKHRNNDNNEDIVSCVYEGQWYLGVTEEVSIENNDKVHFYEPAGPRTSSKISRDDKTWVPAKNIPQKLTPTELTTVTGRSDITPQLCEDISKFLVEHQA